MWVHWFWKPTTRATRDVHQQLAVRGEAIGRRLDDRWVTLNTMVALAVSEAGLGWPVSGQREALRMLDYSRKTGAPPRPEHGSLRARLCRYLRRRRRRRNRRLIAGRAHDSERARPDGGARRALHCRHRTLHVRRGLRAHGAARRQGELGRDFAEPRVHVHRTAASRGACAAPILSLKHARSRPQTGSTRWSGASLLK